MRSLLTTTSPTARITTLCQGSDLASTRAPSIRDRLRRTVLRLGIWAKQERNFLDAEGTKFTQQHNVPLWVGEFGSVYNGPPDENGDRLRALDDQIGIFESNEAHWTTWNYKDVGVMGMLTLNRASPYMERISDLLRKKAALGTDDWMSWLPPTPVKDATAQLAEQIRQVVE